jgi:uncharacterized protein YheU (UPF0270 family)
MIIPHNELSDDALSGLIEEFVTRDGTEMSDASAKAAIVRKGLDRGDLLVVYDPKSESCNIVPADNTTEIKEAW